MEKDKEYPEFNRAANELDLMSLEGIFGEESRQLVLDRDNYEVIDYLIKVLLDWHEDKNQINKNKTYQYTFIIFNLYVEAVKVNPQKSIELISSFKLGNKNNTEMEFMTAYAEFAKVFNDFKALSIELNKNPNSIPLKLRYGKSVSVAYLNGIEYISKTLNLLICLEKIINKESYNFYKINKMKLYEKIELFNVNNKYDDLLEMIDRNLRNAEAHGDITYVLKTNDYKMKYRDNGKIKEKNISFISLFEKLAFVGCYVQSFEFAGHLLYIGLEDREKFIRTYDGFFK